MISLNCVSCLLYFGYPFKVSTMISSYFKSNMGFLIAIKIPPSKFSITCLTINSELKGLWVVRIHHGTATVALYCMSLVFHLSEFTYCCDCNRVQRDINYGKARKNISPPLNSLHVSTASADSEGGRLESRANLRTLAMMKLNTEIKDK